MTLKADKIKLNPDNPRIIKDEKYEKLVQSLKDFPEMASVREVVVNKDNVILGGNMRFKAMLEAGWTDIPVKVVDWTEEKQKEFVIKDNASFGEWDWDAVADQYELEDLEAWGIDVPDILQNQDEVVEDEAPEVSSEPPVSQLGSIYQLGRHRVMCGDSTDKDNVELLMDRVKADMVFTDPPYGIDWNTDYRRYSGRYDNTPRKKYDKVANDEVPFDPRLFLTQADKCLFFGANCYSELLPKGNWIVWDKRYDNGSAMLADAEVAWYSGSGAVYIVQETSQGFHHSDDSKYHPTQKPVKLLGKIFDKIKAPNILLDPYIGSGSTLIACEQTDRTCYGMELDPKYVDVIRKRYVKFISPDTWETEWEALTPSIQGNNKESNGES